MIGYDIFIDAGFKVIKMKVYFLYFNKPKETAGIY